MHSDPNDNGRLRYLSYVRSPVLLVAVLGTADSALHKPSFGAAFVFLTWRVSLLPMMVTTHHPRRSGDIP